MTLPLQAWNGSNRSLRHGRRMVIQGRDNCNPPNVGPSAAMGYLTQRSNLQWYGSTSLGGFERHSKRTPEFNDSRLNVLLADGHVQFMAGSDLWANNCQRFHLDGIGPSRKGSFWYFWQAP